MDKKMEHEFRLGSHKHFVEVEGFCRGLHSWKMFSGYMMYIIHVE